MTDAPARNVNVPVGVPEEPAAEAVNVTICPGTEGLRPEAIERVAVVLKVAVTFRVVDIVTLHAPVPEQSPDHPVNAEPGGATAVSETTVPAMKLVEQDVPQLMAAGLDVTVPVPTPVSETLRDTRACTTWLSGDEIAGALAPSPG
jgi:hypothetical protein